MNMHCNNNNNKYLFIFLFLRSLYENPIESIPKFIKKLPKLEDL